MTLASVAGVTPPKKPLSIPEGDLVVNLEYSRPISSLTLVDQVDKLELIKGLLVKKSPLSPFDLHCHLFCIPADFVICLFEDQFQDSLVTLNS